MANEREGGRQQAISPFSSSVTGGSGSAGALVAAPLERYPPPDSPQLASPEAPLSAMAFWRRFSETAHCAWEALIAARIRF